jgi:hypothetical protein
MKTAYTLYDVSGQEGDLRHSPHLTPAAALGRGLTQPIQAPRCVTQGRSTRFIMSFRGFGHGVFSACLGLAVVGRPIWSLVAEGGSARGIRDRTGLDQRGGARGRRRRIGGERPATRQHEPTRNDTKRQGRRPCRTIATVSRPRCLSSHGRCRWFEASHATACRIAYPSFPFL